MKMQRRRRVADVCCRKAFTLVVVHGKAMRVELSLDSCGGSGRIKWGGLG